MATFTHDTYISPLTWRYGSAAMRSLFSEQHKRILLRKVWVALAEAEHDAGLVTDEQVAELKAHQQDIDIDRSSQIEAEIHHDLMAEIRTYAEQCPTAGAIIHLGATSMDIEDNAEALRLSEAMDEIIAKVKKLLSAFVEKMRIYRDTPCMAFTHIQPAEPTTIGYRFAQTAQDLTEDLRELKQVRKTIRGKGMKGAVGTSASYGELLKGTGMTTFDLERKVMDSLGLSSFTAATQVYSRKQDLRIAQAIANLDATLAQFAINFRILMSPPIGEWSEPFGSKQVGSSAMPFKRNPINSEKIDSLARYASSLTAPLWQNTSYMLLERTLDDSANRRLILPSLFLTTDEILLTATKVVTGMVIHQGAVKRNLDTYGLFASSERLLMELGRKGADRQKMHEEIREASLKAWDAVQNGKPNPLKDELSSNATMLRYLSKEEIASFLDASDYIGDAPARTDMVIAEAQKEMQA